ncbi:hypothetical protein CKU38_04205 [Xanthomonas citri pv. fuscans]|nr:hypothetical protein CKU38_04205 [Xanthomonas citri pv. fuscans]
MPSRCKAANTGWVYSAGTGVDNAVPLRRTKVSASRPSALSSRNGVPSGGVSSRLP